MFLISYNDKVICLCRTCLSFLLVQTNVPPIFIAKAVLLCSGLKGEPAVHKIATSIRNTRSVIPLEGIFVSEGNAKDGASHFSSGGLYFYFCRFIQHKIPQDM